MSETAALPAPPEAHEPTEETRRKVRTIAKVKTKPRYAAKELGITERTFLKHYRTEWEEGQEEARSGLLAKLLAQGMAGNVTAAGKYFELMGFRAAVKVEVAGPDGGPIQTIDVSLFTSEQLETYGRLSAIAEGLDPDVFIDQHRPN